MDRWASKVARALGTWKSGQWEVPEGGYFREISGMIRNATSELLITSVSENIKCGRRSWRKGDEGRQISSGAVVEQTKVETKGEHTNTLTGYLEPLAAAEDREGGLK
uniref:Uncharacterized protein n=1 Tax=Coccidioides posadasii RMSCC 3488 TaxID=454284 RepID=A0A0J6FUH0_COCPO|nr:hypothetical protein CPAG_09339 [Coccidioides posadasii RMSCC 3488]